MQGVVPSRICRSGDVLVDVRGGAIRSKVLAHVWCYMCPVRPGAEGTPAGSSGDNCLYRYNLTQYTGNVGWLCLACGVYVSGDGGRGVFPRNATRASPHLPVSGIV